MTTSSWLVAYDIRDPRRLLRVGRYMKRQGLHVQYSVFLVRCNEVRLDRLRDDLTGLIDLGLDDVRMYRLPPRPHWSWLGRRAVPADVHLINDDGVLLPGVSRAQHASAEPPARVGEDGPDAQNRD